MSKAKKRVVILDQVSGYAQIDIMEALCSVYDECVLLAGEVKERNKPIPDQVYWDKIIQYNRKTFLNRMYTWLVGGLQMFIKVFFKYRDARIIAISNPPLAIFVPWILRCNYDVVIYDIYPDALINMGFLKESSILGSLWRKLNELTFKGATRIITLSDGMKEVLSRYSNVEKIEVIPNWSFNKDLAQVPKNENLILKKLGVSDKFIISYSGNFGLTHPIEVLVKVASKLDPNVFHVIVAGDGARKTVIETELKRIRPKNFSLLSWQSVDMLDHVLSMGDIGVVVLDENASNISIPSKTYDLLSAGTPILGICSELSSLSVMLKELDCGIGIKSDEINSLIFFLEEVAKNPKILENFATNALKASKEFTSFNALKYV